VNKVCAHVACSAQTVCLIEQLQIVRDNYRGRIDQFRIKVWPIPHALCRCCRQHLLEVHPAQLRCCIGCHVVFQLCTTGRNLTAQLKICKYCCFCSKGVPSLFKSAQHTSLQGFALRRRPPGLEPPCVPFLSFCTTICF